MYICQLHALQWQGLRDARKKKPTTTTKIDMQQHLNNQNPNCNKDLYTTKRKLNHIVTKNNMFLYAWTSYRHAVIL